MIHFLVPGTNADLAADYIRRAELEDDASVITFEELLALDTVPFGAYVFTGINRLGPATAAWLADVHALLGAATGITPLNHPVRSLRRYELIRALHSDGRIPYTAFGAWESFAEVRLPAFVRSREDDGDTPELQHSLHDLEREVGVRLMEGRTAEELVIVEFCDTSVDGVFTKYSAYRVGDRYLAKDVDRGDAWVLRLRTSDITEALVRDEGAYQATNPHEDQLRDIFERARIEFGRIDYSMLDGRVICWEINTLPLLRYPTGLPDLPEDVRRAQERGRARFDAEFTDAFQALLGQVEEARSISERPRTIRLEHDPETLAAARAEVRRRGITTTPVEAPRLATVRALLRPLKPIVRPIAERVLYPLMARWARRG